MLQNTKLTRICFGLTSTVLEYCLTTLYLNLVKQKLKQNGKDTCVLSTEIGLSLELWPALDAGVLLISDSFPLVTQKQTKNGFEAPIFLWFV